MEVNSSIYKTNIDKDLDMLHLLEKAKKSMYDYFEETLQENTANSLAENFSLDVLDKNVKLISYGIRFDVEAESLFQFCIVFQINSTQNTFLYNYYSYFDSKGNLIDNFVDK